MKQNSVIKFGGTSLATSEMMNQALHITQQAFEKNQVTVVVSALGGVTNVLIELAQLAKASDVQVEHVFEELLTRHKEQFYQITQQEFSVEMMELFDQLKNVLIQLSQQKSNSAKLMDEIMSFGERLSVRMFVAGLNHRGIPAVFRETQELIKTDSQFGDAHVHLEQSAKNLKQAVEETDGLVVFTGFIGSNDKNEITTLGRSGSDFTAGLVGFALDADLVEIWTDVDGVFTTDPNLIKTAKLIPELSYAFMEKMADNGAKVLHPRTVRPLQLKEIPILIKNTFNPLASGTLVDVKSYADLSPIITVGIRKNQLFISAEDLKRVRKKINSELFEYLEEKAIQIQTHKVVAGVSLHKNNEHIAELNSLIFPNDGEFKSIAQITMLSTGSFQNTQLYKAIDLISTGSIRVFGYLFENNSTISIFVNEESSNEALQLVHDFFCLN